MPELDVWKDSRKVEGADFYDDTIDRAIRGSAVMISVMSANTSVPLTALRNSKLFCDHE